jgi:excisionase family DNA binding protein
MTELPLVLTIEEVAKCLRIGRSAAYAGVRSGDIPGAIRIGRSLRVPRHALEQLLQTAPGTSPGQTNGAAGGDAVTERKTANDQSKQGSDRPRVR